MKHGFLLVEHIYGFSFPLRPTGLRAEARSRLSRASCAPSSGFSLVELSIVLVILGLLTGGILAGQNLIRAAELRSVSTQFNQYMSAVHTFRDKYFAIPGDMRNATAFWGTQTGSVPTGYDAACAGLTHTTPSTTTSTCNGDGDGLIGAVGASTERYERYRFWQHLANAGLIEGNYTGVTGSGSAFHAVLGENVPRAKLSPAGFAIRHFQSGSNAAGWDNSVGNLFIFGAATTGDSLFTAAIQPEEAWNIDTKMDDGRPGTGRVFSNNPSSCTTSTSSATAEYALTLTGTSCLLYLTGGF